jgi:hypothetical protein
VVRIDLGIGQMKMEKLKVRTLELFLTPLKMLLIKFCGSMIYDIYKQKSLPKMLRQALINKC